LVLANGYLFTALIVIPHALTFPGAFTPTGLLGAHFQTALSLYIFWHLGLSVAMVGYAWLRGANRTITSSVSTPSIIGWSAVVTMSLVVGLTRLAIVGDELLPRLQNGPDLTPFAFYLLALITSISAFALALLWMRRRSVLDEWLIVVTCAMFAELAATALFNTERFSVGWYAGRMFSLVTSIVVLVVLLAETSKLYSGLLRSNLMMQRERNNKLMSLESVVASISHEVRQPLSAIVSNGSAALGLLAHAPPNLEDARSALQDIVSDSHRASKIFDNIREIIRTNEQERKPIDVNDMALGALRLLRRDLEDHGIITHADLMPALPRVMGHMGQLQEVVLNLVQNAVEAMDAVEEGSRVLRLKTQRDGRDAIIVAVQDSGPGIDPEQLDNIFDTFVTTKPQGMGVGLAICRMIVERHGGRLSAWSDKKGGGALFQFMLPVKPVAGSTIGPV
jgi:signal transduction histidine kinase